LQSHEAEDNGGVPPIKQKPRNESDPKRGGKVRRVRKRRGKKVKEILPLNEEKERTKSAIEYLDAGLI